jgi:transposase-like protein/IS1 family transposase
MATRQRACPACGSCETRPYGSYRTKHGRRRRYRCRTCERTFSSGTGTLYHGLQRARRTFDLVASLSVEGVSKSAISRAVGISWNTVARWLERAAERAQRFSDERLRGFELVELQMDEIRTFVGGKGRPTWIFTSIEVWSRLWPTTVVGGRNRRNTLLLLSDIQQRSRFERPPLITTDGFSYYAKAVRRIYDGACVYGQVMKTWRKDRIAKVEKREVFGAAWQFERALEESEDSRALNTAFVERLNLTARCGSSYLHRRSPCHARKVRYLEEHLQLLRCHYNFVRPHRALRFGKVTRTPAMQAGLAARRYSFRDIFGLVVPGARRSGTVLAWKLAPRHGFRLLAAA